MEGAGDHRDAAAAGELEGIFGCFQSSQYHWRRSFAVREDAGADVDDAASEW